MQVPQMAITQISLCIMVTACPKINVFRPACPAFSIDCTRVNNTVPNPKKVAKIVAKAASKRTPFWDVLYIIHSDKQAVQIAPSNSTVVSFTPVRRNPATTPGSVEWATPSPSKLS